MWPSALVSVLLVVATTDAITTQACSRTETPGTPSPTPPAPPSSDIFTTQDGVRFVVETPVTTLDVPWSLAFAPDGRLFLTERAGRVRILDVTAMRAELALTLDDVFTQGEAGLLGIALDPDFSQNRHVYLYYTAATGGGAANRVLRFRESGARLTDRVTLLDGIPAASIHDGGRLRFGPDRLLYITTGDAANTSLAPELSSYAGKILRLNTDGTSPRENPFSSPVFSYGHRNPQGLDWHPTTGDLWASEHGASGNDEVNAIRSGVNYGWPRIEGAETLPDMQAPAAFFTPSIAPSGASFYRGSRFPAFHGDLFVAMLRGMHLLRLRLNAAGQVTSQERLLDGRFGRLRDVQSGPDGAIYVLTNNRDGRGNPTSTDDRLLRLVPAP
jgi:glucose/arabinose dehydrogenase